MKGRPGARDRLVAVVTAVFLLFSLGACAPAPDGAAGAIPEARTKADSARWIPAPALTWQWQLSGALDLSVDADIYDVDYETTTPADILALNTEGRRSICYLSVGSWEDFRGDAGLFPEAVLGNTLDGWPDERWLDIRRMDVLLPIMAARMDTCAAKGFDAVEPDNVDGYVNETGFPLTADDQLAYNRAVAELAHARGLSVGLKNDVDQIPELVDDFDFAVNEECFRYGECEAYKPFADEGKAVLHVEYQGSLDFCAESRRIGLSSMLKPLDLGPARSSC
ncbi:endo alpha-1,4 polygalactosaminidase [Arthrobacter gengyunqii]|uniref:Endo alpha-1,4 polygalactosaminidase n=1 Tax=Arthrobacter gengyunqii TaxID=2886940 RepID=A0ABS8GIH3_9MICC|nr:endo alpha-1,4 polygalactosaminidase [Arthrobacter gengyunqii]